MSAKRKAVRERPDPPRQRRVYLESSALVAGLIEHDQSVIPQVRPSETTMSALTITEARRAVIRATIAGRITPDQAREAGSTIDVLAHSCEILPITDDILARAGRRFPVEPVRTLDAIHLASAELLDSPENPVTVLTRDERIRENALRLGLMVV